MRQVPCVQPKYNTEKSFHILFIYFNICQYTRDNVRFLRCTSLPVWLHKKCIKTQHKNQG